MRKYLVLLPILSIIIILPAAYARWSDTKKANQITDTITQARQVNGNSLSSILTKENAKDQITILYTGNTQSELDPCGYYRGNSGGIARRATVVERLRKSGFAPLVLDAGEIFSGETPLDQMRSETYLKTMGMMGYDAACISASEFRFGKEYLRGQMDVCGVPFISSNLFDQESKETYAEPYIIRNVGRFRVRVIGVSNITSSGDGLTGIEPIAALKSHINKLRKEADLVILLSNLTIPETRNIATKLEGINVIISSKSGEPEKVKNTMIYYSDAKGRTMGLLSLSLDGSGNIVSNSNHVINLQDDTPNDTEVTKLVSGFYYQVADNPNMLDVWEPLSASNAQDQNTDNAYIGSSDCAKCHSKEYEQWSMTPHAASFHTIKKIERDRYPDCVSCHTTGFGYETGYSINRPKDILRSVGCEMCHGPGERHSYEPTKENIRGKVSREICAQCHTDEYSPGLMDIVELIMPRIEHDQKSASIKEILDDRISSSTLKPTVDLFVMSYCPFGVMAENKLIPIINEFNGKVDFNLYFIADKEKKATKSVTSQFKSMHGEKELIEDIRQVVIGKYYKDRLLGYILERNKELKGNWEDVAKNLGIDPAKVQKMVESKEGATLFSDNIKKGHELDIHGSPTIMVNSVKLSNSIIYAKKTTRNLCK